MSEKMSAAEIVSDISARLISMGVDVGDENAIMAGVEALQREADGLREALEGHREFWSRRAHGFSNDGAWLRLCERTDAALDDSPHAAAVKGSGALPMRPAPDRPELTALIAEAKARYDALSPEEKDAYDKAQRESWVRGEMALGLDDDRSSAALQDRSSEEK